MPVDYAKIRRLREGLGLNLRQAAERAKVTDKHRLSAIERGVVPNITVKTLENIAAALGVKAKDLL